VFLEARRDLPLGDMPSRRDDAQDHALAALVLARLGRMDEARERAAKALAFQREIAALGGDDELRKREMALALVAAAWAEPGRAQTLLAEAQAALDSMPAEARGLRYSRWIDGLIADARRGAR